MTVYVLHLDPPVRHARHYIGFTTDQCAQRRIRQHTAGHRKGSPLVRAAVSAGHDVHVAHVFAGDKADRNFERRLKNRNDTPRWCPICNPDNARLPKLAEEVTP